MERQQELERLYNARKFKGHAPQISINDPDAYVTDTFSSYYGADDASSPTSPGPGPGLGPGPPPPKQQDAFRPLSYMNAPSERESFAARSRRQGGVFDQHHQQQTNQNHHVPQNEDRYQAEPHARRPSPPRTRSSEKMPSPTHASPAPSPKSSVHRMSSLGGESSRSPTSPPPLSRQSSSGETAVQAFPLNDIDYESSPAAVAQELSNLQAIRRMSMNVDTADPDLPSFSGPFAGIPTLAPKQSDDENDPSKLFWVPARLHPELAPKEFRTFIEDKVDRIRRRSGGEDNLSPDSPERSGSDGSSLRRKKSMLSHSIDTKGHYEDGAERLERKKSKRVHVEGQAMVANLSELEELVNDPAQLMRRMSLDTVRRSQDSGIEVPPTEDMPILPPVGTLKRSTRTTYRRGSLKKGERVPFSKRAQHRQTGSDAEESTQSPIVSAPEEQEHEPIVGISRVQTEPTPAPSETHLNFSRPSQRRVNGLGGSHSSENLPAEPEIRKSPPEPTPAPAPAPEEEQREGTQRSQYQPNLTPRQFQSRIASAGRTTAQLPGYTNNNPLPHLVETLSDGTKVPVSTLVQQIPERRSSHDIPRQYQRGGAHMRPVPGRSSSPNSTLDDISSHPTPLPGSGGTRTDALTMVPTFSDEKAEKKEAPRKSSWKWFVSSDDDAKDKKSKDEKTKAGKLTKTQADKARLDVLQNSIDGTIPPRGRESLVLNREDLKLDEGAQKGGKKSSDSSRKEKDKEFGLLSAIFGGKKKSSDGDLKEKKRKADRGLSPDPTPRILKPDIDYNWTRFSILEERAIYRMAHIKLANPRRALCSQVLLSNFMYSYLAKVQMMHPQIQIPPAQRAAQQRGQRQPDPQQQSQQQQQQQQQPAEYNQYQRWQEVSHDGRSSSDIAFDRHNQQQQARQDSSANGSHNDASGRSSFDTDGSAQRSSFDHSEPSTNGYDRRSSEDFGRQSSEDYNRQSSEDYNRQGYSSQSGAPRTNGASSSGGSGGHAGYSVASTHDYLGYPKDEQSFGSQSSWEDDKEELW